MPRCYWYTCGPQFSAMPNGMGIPGVIATLCSCDDLFMCMLAGGTGPHTPARETSLSIVAC